MTDIGNGLVVFGMPGDDPARIPIELPDDVQRTRVRYRNDDFARIWLKTSCGIRAFYLAWKDDAKKVLVPVCEQGANFRK